MQTNSQYEYIIYPGKNNIELLFLLDLLLLSRNRDRYKIVSIYLKMLISIATFLKNNPILVFEQSRK